MLKSLHIKNLALIESCGLEFSNGFHVFTGETGSGKSALLNAIKLLLGSRADQTSIRKGFDRAIIEASFEISNNSDIYSLLDNHAIEHDKEDYLLIKREINADSKSRSFLNNQMAPLFLLQKIGTHLVDFVSQHANQELISVSYHRECLDNFANLKKLKDNLASLYKEEEILLKSHQKLIEKSKSTSKEKIRLLQNKEEIDTLKLKNNEEEDLFNEYIKLNHAEEILLKANDILLSLNEKESSILFQLKEQKKAITTIVQKDLSLLPLEQSFNQVIIELDECVFTLRTYITNTHADPNRLSSIDERLKLIHKAKQKYGSSFEEFIRYRKSVEDELQLLSELEDHLYGIKEKLTEVQKQGLVLSNKLSLKRKNSKLQLEKSIITYLKRLNFKNSSFQVDIREITRNKHGQDEVEFYLSPNLGEKPVSLKECASGGGAF